MSLSLRRRAYNSIRQKLLLGDIPTGQRLYEVAIAKEIGISRTPVREAMTQLVSEGLVEQVPSGGVAARRVSRAELLDIHMIRYMHEGYGAFRAARRISPEEISQLRMLMNRMRELSRIFRAQNQQFTPELEREMVTADVGFHMLILKASHSPWVAKIISDFQVLTRRYSSPSVWKLGHLSRVLLQHWRVFKAIERRDAKGARQAMRQHIREGRKRMLRTFDQEAGANHTSVVLGDWSGFFAGLLAERTIDRKKRPAR